MGQAQTVHRLLNVSLHLEGFKDADAAVVCGPLAEWYPGLNLQEQSACKEDLSTKKKEVNQQTWKPQHREARNTQS